MKIIGIVGSRRKGNTYTMIETAISKLTDVEAEIIHLDKDFNLCDGCLICDNTGECKFNDYISVIVKKMADADGFIFGTPSRWGLLSGELKGFFDRLNPLAVPKALKGKKAIIFAVGQCEGEDAESIRLAADTVEYFCDSAQIQVVDKLVIGGCLNPSDLIDKPEELGICREKALLLVEALKKD